MRTSKRIRRMGRNKKVVTGLNLTSLMDVFTILVFFLLFHASGSEVMEAPKQIKLPDSVVEAGQQVPAPPDSALPARTLLVALDTLYSEIIQNSDSIRSKSRGWSVTDAYPT